MTKLHPALTAAFLLWGEAACASTSRSPTKTSPTSTVLPAEARAAACERLPADEVGMLATAPASTARALPARSETLGDAVRVDEITKPNVTFRKCIVSRLREQLGVDRLSVLDPDVGFLWPGAILQGEPLQSGRIVPMVGRQAPVHITVSAGEIALGDEQVQATYRTVLGATHRAITRNQSPLPARIRAEKFKASTIESALIRAGISVQALDAVAVNAGLARDQTSEQQALVFRFTQAYYDVSVSEMTPETAMCQPSRVAIVSPSNPAVYVSNVTYGRMMVLVMDASRINSALEAQVEASADLRIVNGRVEGRTRLTSDQRTARFHAIVLGGDATQAARLMTLSGDDPLAAIDEFLVGGAQRSPSSPAVPIAFAARYLSTGDVAQFGLVAEYSKRSCGDGEPIVPEYVSFGNDPHSKYRLYEDVRVPKGQLAVAVHNQWPHDDVKFEVWQDDRGATYRVQTGTGPTTNNGGGPLSNIERLVWYGHTTLMMNRPLPTDAGWRLEFLRVD